MRIVRVLLATALFASSAAAAGRPNIIFIMADENDYFHFSLAALQRK